MVVVFLPHARSELEIVPLGVQRIFKLARDLAYQPLGTLLWLLGVDLDVYSRRPVVEETTALRDLGASDL